MKNGLKRESDFNLVFSKGKRRTSNTITMLYVKANTQKVGYCVSKKHGKAHLRNYVKRLLRASFCFYKKNVGNYFIVFLPKISDRYDFNKIKSDMEYLLKKENLINEISVS